MDPFARAIASISPPVPIVHWNTAFHMSSVREIRAWRRTCARRKASGIDVSICMVLLLDCWVLHRRTYQIPTWNRKNLGLIGSEQPVFNQTERVTLHGE
jgi:hypothetical protein